MMKFSRIGTPFQGDFRLRINNNSAIIKEMVALIFYYLEYEISLASEMVSAVNNVSSIAHFQPLFVSLS